LTTSEVRDAAAGGLDWSRHVAGRSSRASVHVWRRSKSSSPPPSREPWPGYDGATVEQIKRRLADCDMDALQRVRRYEQRHKRRKGVLGALDTQARRLAR